MTQALHTLLQHIENQRDAAQAALLQAEAAVRRLNEQTTQLLAYRDDYRRRHPAQDGRSASIELLRCHQGFMQRLDQALAQQQGTVQTAQNRCGLLRNALVDKETRLASVRKLLERRGQQTALDGARQDQRRSDDAAQHRRRDSAGAAGTGAPGWRLGTEAMPLSI